MTHTVSQLEVSPSTFREIKRKLDEACYPTCAARIDMHGLEIVCGDPSHEEAQYLADVENAFRHGHSKGRVDPDYDKAAKAYMAEQSGRRQWRGSK